MEIAVPAYFINRVTPFSVWKYPSYRMHSGKCLPGFMSFDFLTILYSVLVHNHYKVEERPFFKVGIKNKWILSSCMVVPHNIYLYTFFNMTTPFM